MNINVYKQISKPSVLATTTVKEWFQLIRNSDYSNQIIEARKDQSKEALRALKYNLPCVTYNFLYHQYKKDTNIISSTGLMFIDIDSTEFKIESVDKTKILGYYKSVGGSGFHIVVRVNGVTTSNFKQTYINICEVLNISSHVDEKAIKHSQFSLLSFDANAYYHDSPFVFEAYPIVSPSHVISDERTYIDNTCIPIISNVQKKNTYTYDRDTVIRFDNLDEIEIQEEDNYIVNWDGYEFIKAWIPIKKLTDGRKRFLLSYTTNLVYLNQHQNYEKLMLILHNVSQAAFEAPLPPDNIQNTLNSVLMQLREEKLKPIYFRHKRKIVFNKKASLNRAEKQSIVLQELAIRKTNASILKIQTLIDNWDKEWGIITARKLSNCKLKVTWGIKITSKTINKYYKHFKKDIKLINDAILGRNENKNVLKMNKNNNLLDNIYEFNTEEINYKYDDYLTVIRNINAEASATIKVKSPTMDATEQITLMKNDIHNCLNTCEEITFNIQIELFDKVKQIAKLDSSIRPDLLYSDFLRQYSYKRELLNYTLDL